MAVTTNASKTTPAAKKAHAPKKKPAGNAGGDSLTVHFRSKAEHAATVTSLCQGVGRAADIVAGERNAGMRQILFDRMNVLLQSAARVAPAIKSETSSEGSGGTTPAKTTVPAPITQAANA